MAMKQEDSRSEVEYEDISHHPLIKKLQSQTVAFADGFVRIHPYNQVFPKCMANYLRTIFDFEVKEDDIWISSFPKCGTTWTQEMIWCLKNNLDFVKAESLLLDQRVPFFEESAITPAYASDKNSITDVDKLQSPRIIKTHLKFDMLPLQCMKKKVKIIYVARNPRDACVSYYNHWRLLEAYTGSLEDFTELFLNDICGFYTPFIPHVLSYWNRTAVENRTSSSDIRTSVDNRTSLSKLRTSSSNILFITFEEMKTDLPSVIQRMAKFLGVQISSDDITRLADHLSFEKMKKNPMVNKKEYAIYLNELYKEQYGKNKGAEKIEFMRKGKVGNWKEHFSNEQIDRFKQWEAKGLQGSTFQFQYE